MVVIFPPANACEEAYLSNLSSGSFRFLSLLATSSTLCMSSIDILSNFLVSSMGILISFSALSLPFMFILFAIIDCVYVTIVNISR